MEPREQDADFGRREIAIVLALLVVAGVAGWVDVGGGAADDVLDAVALVLGAAFWAALLWFVFGRDLWRRRRAPGPERR
jgi:hypothetical protein